MVLSITAVPTLLEHFGVFRQFTQGRGRALPFDPMYDFRSLVRVLLRRVLTVTCHTGLLDLPFEEAYVLCASSTRVASGGLAVGSVWSRS